MDIQERRVAGGVIINERKEIFLIESPKWSAWHIPGGGVEAGESDEEGYLREIQEELSVPVIIIKKLGEKIKEPSTDFQNSNMRFHFVDFLAFMKTEDIAKIQVNEEISNYKWVQITEIPSISMVDSSRHLVESALESIKSLDIEHILSL